MKLKTVKFVKQAGPPGPKSANATDRWVLDKHFDAAVAETHFVRFTRTVGGVMFQTLIPYAAIQFAEAVPLEVKKTK